MNYFQGDEHTLIVTKAGVQLMVRSLSFIYLFVILAIGYLGGTLLFRELPVVSVEKMLAIFDARVVNGHEVNFIWPAVMTSLFFIIVYLLSLIKKFRFPILLIGALKCVIFGLSSAYLLASGMKILEYAVWWFPFQFATGLLLLMFCAILSPPFFVRTIGRRKRNDKALFVIIILIIIVTTVEILIFNLLLN